MTDLPPALPTTSQQPDIPPELDRWNWGAFLLNWIWGIGNSTFIALLALIPGVNVIMMIVLGARGSRWAWRNRLWRDPEHFRRTQRNWAVGGVVVWILVIGGFGGCTYGVFAALKGSDAFRMTMTALRSDPQVRSALGSELKDGFWVTGSIGVNALDGSGQATLQIPLTGDRGAGAAMSKAVRTNGVWEIRLLIVRVDGRDTPIVVINREGRPVPGAAIGI